MPDLAHRRCTNHAAREAVARCPECGWFYCRECITEHENRVVCANCLRRLGGAATAGRGVPGRLLRVLLSLIGLAAAWLIFYALGSALLEMPSDFHEGKIWNTRWWEAP